MLNPYELLIIQFQWKRPELDHIFRHLTSPTDLLTNQFAFKRDAINLRITTIVCYKTEAFLHNTNLNIFELATFSETVTYRESLKGQIH